MHFNFGDPYCKALLSSLHLHREDYKCMLLRSVSGLVTALVLRCSLNGFLIWPKALVSMPFLGLSWEGSSLSMVTSVSSPRSVTLLRGPIVHYCKSCQSENDLDNISVAASCTADYAWSLDKAHVG